ncbi:VRR-NUC domain-containing protein [Clostridium amylolyticum]|uniref:VRR-NUC domain-containing protein n=1 Tax=Clostridium amylolyticum TaxID=1121298 RepID=A0A1M6EZ72_9CLOT|nr:VRR-NUC domain-containing protein [Clostridium amylolyticum]
MFPLKKEGDILQESTIEKRLKKEIELIGGKALKFVSPGMSGVPDRIVLLPHGKLIFVELKAPGEKPRPIQNKRIKELRALGFRVEIIDSIEKVLEFMEEVVV